MEGGWAVILSLHSHREGQFSVLEGRLYREHSSSASPRPEVAAQPPLSNNCSTNTNKEERERQTHDLLSKSGAYTGTITLKDVGAGLCVEDASINQ